MKNIALIICLVGFPQLAETIYTPALPAVATGLGATISAVEATLAIYFIGFALGVLIWGTISDQIGRRKTMLIGIALFIGSCFFCSLSPTVGSLLFWRFFQALGASVGSVITQTMLRDTLEGKERAQVFSIISGALAFSPAIGPILGGTISEIFEWRMNFWFLVLLGAILFIWSYFALHETKPAHKTEEKVARRMFTSRNLWGHILIIGAANGFIFSFYQEAPFVFIEQMGIRPSLYGLIGILIASATIIAAKISHRWKGSPETIIRIGAFLSLFGGIGFPFGLSGAVASLFIAFIGIGLTIPSSLSIALQEYKGAAGTAGSLFGGAYYVLIALATGALSFFLFPLPPYLTFLGSLLMIGSYVVRPISRLTRYT